MRKAGKKWMLILAAALALSACGGGKTPQSAGGGAPAANGESGATGNGAATSGGGAAADGGGKADISQRVDLVMYQLGPRPARYDQVLERFNEMALKDLNCTLSVNFIEYGDIATKYPLIFSSGEEFDLAYSGNWVNFANLAQKGAFMPLEDLLPVYCEESLKLEPEDALKQATINGHVYAYPTNFYTYSAYGVVVRGDMMKKYGFDEIKNFDDYFAYLEAVKAGESQFTNVAGIANNHVLTDIYLESKGLYPLNGGQYGMYYIDQSSGSPVVIAAHEWSGYEDYLNLAKGWADKGLWPKSALSIKDTAQEMFRAGTAAGALGNFDQGIDTRERGNQEWDIRWYNVQPNVNHLAYTQDCVVVPSSSKNPERALMLLDKIKTDETYYNLLTYGIEGEDFTRDERNRFTCVDRNQFQPESGTWGYRSQQFFLVSATAPEDFAEQKQAIEDITVDNIFRNFNMDTDPVKSEYAAMQNVYSQYNAPLRLGMTTDIQKDLAQLKEKAAAAGNDKIKAELQRQVDGFYAANNQ